MLDETFGPGDDHHEACMPCVEAIMDAASIGLRIGILSVEPFTVTFNSVCLRVLDM